MNSRMWALRVLALVAIVGAAACSEDNKPEAAAEQELLDRTNEVHVVIDATGAETIHLDKTAKIRVLARKGVPSDMRASVISITSPEPITLEDGRLLMIEVANVGAYRGQKSIKIEPVSEEERANPETPVRGVAGLTLITDTPRLEKKYSLTEGSCTLVVEDNGLKGSADCPALSAGAETVRMKVRWGD